ncbi:hypothetical protein FOCC_FOCC012670 [Frankliniella occidentalis]|nr:hypothetical protein FOCC_FOCC012670 [Frankliniella occidentalis]
MYRRPDLIEDCTTAKEAFEKLQHECTNYNALHIVQFLIDLVSVKKTDKVSMQEYISEINSKHKKLKGSGVLELSDTVIAALYLAGLQDQKNLRELTSEKIRSKLVLEEMREKSKKGREQSESAIALKVQKNFTYKKSFHKNFSNPGNDKPGGSGKPEDKVNDGEKRSNEERRNDEDRRNDKSNRIYFCYACGGRNHKAANCPKAAAARDEEQPKKKAEAKVASRKYRALCAKSVVPTASTNESDDVWDFIPMEGEVSVGKGKVLLHMSSECGGYDLEFKEALNVPELKDNLLSQGYLEAKGLKIICFDGVVEIFDGEEIMLKSHRIGTLYFITTVGSPDVEDIEKLFKEEERKASNVSVQTWHDRLGHPNDAALSKIPPIGKMLKSTNLREDCEPCIKGKLKCTPVPKEAESKTEKILEKVHSDVAGPIKPMSLGGNKYFVTFLDDHSRFIAAYPMKSKDEVFKLFVKFKNRAEAIHEKKILELQSDNGGEYINHDFKELCDLNGILHRKIIPEKSHQNGCAERLNQTLLNVVRCSLKRSGLPLFFWGEALQTAVTLRNFCPTSGGRIPFEAWNKREMRLGDIKHLTIFGCQAWIAKKDGKLGDRIEECLFLGYPEGVKGYKFWSLERRKIVVMASVDETPTTNKRRRNDPFTPDQLQLDDDDEGEDEDLVFRLPTASEAKLAAYEFLVPLRSKSKDDFHFILLESNVLVKIASLLRCPSCSQSEVTVDFKERKGFCHVLKFKCSLCGEIVCQEYTSPRINRTTSTRPPFEVNRQMAEAFISYGVGHAAMETFAETMGTGCMTTTTFHQHLQALSRALNNFKEEFMNESRRLVREAYELEDEGLKLLDITEIETTFDGSWQKRGHTSNYGVGYVADIKTAWHEEHKSSGTCNKNYEGSSNSMEMAAALIMWKRSEAECKMRFTFMLSDGDAKTHTHLNDNDPYNGIPITKEECINHVIKRLSTGLKKLVVDYKAKGTTLGGSGSGQLLTENVKGIRMPGRKEKRKTSILLRKVKHMLQGDFNNYVF